MNVLLDAQHLADWLEGWIYNRARPTQTEALWRLRIFIVRNFKDRVIGYSLVQQQITDLVREFPEASEILSEFAVCLETTKARTMRDLQIPKISIHGEKGAGKTYPAMTLSDPGATLLLLSLQNAKIEVRVDEVKKLQAKVSPTLICPKCGAHTLHIDAEFVAQPIEAAPESALVRFVIDCQTPDCEYHAIRNMFAELRQVNLRGD